MSGASPTTRRVANGCLVLLALPALLVAWFWYTVWHAGHVNGERERDARASVLGAAREAGDGVARALGARGDTDADALTGVIWKRTGAPVITYDAVRREFTATAFRSVMYEEEAVVLGGGPVQVKRCVGFVYTLGTDGTWESTVEGRDDDVCRRSERIGFLAELVRTRITGMPVADLTRAGIQKALRLRSYDVRDAVRKGGTVTVLVLVRDGLGATGTAGQCYRYDRTGEREATAVPVTTC